MKFEIQEYRQKIKFKNKFLNFVANWTIFPILGILFLCLLPFVLIYNSLFQKKSNEKETIYEFEKLYTSDNLTVERKYLDYYVKEIEDLELDFPMNDYVFKFRTNPKIDLIEELYFDYNFFETENGFFLISLNQIPNGMKLWFLNKQNFEFQNVKSLVSADWNFKKDENKIILSTQTDKEEIKFEINQY